MASALHRRSARAERSFVAVNCGAIAAELIESELFGHMKGSFTGADRDRAGLWEEADGGTVFLDEITETSPAFQVKLLRALQEGEIRRVGSNRTQRVDVRVIAASNRDVEDEVKAGRFRQDLFYRLNAVSIVLPPLRERREDILPLAKSFAEQVYSLNPAVTFAPDALRLMGHYPWPGNIRELENAGVRAAAMCDARSVATYGRVRQLSRGSGSGQWRRASGVRSVALEWQSLREVEGRYSARGHTGGNKQLLRLLGVDRETVERIVRRQNSRQPSNPGS